MKYRVSFNSGTGHDDIDEDESPGDPTFVEFATEAERAAFLKGVDMTREVMNGWVDAWVDAHEVG